MILLVLMLIIMLMRITLPIGARIAGKMVKEIRLSFQERLILQRINVYAIGIVLLLTAVTGVVSRGWEILVLLAVLVMLLMRVRYLVTSEGIAINNVVYRSWREFNGFEVRRREIRLLPRQGFRPFDLKLLGKHREEAIILIKSYLKESQESKEPISNK